MNCFTVITSNALSACSSERSRALIPLVSKRTHRGWTSPRSCDRLPAGETPSFTVMAEAPLISRIPGVEVTNTTGPLPSSSKAQKAKPRTRDKDAFATKRRCVSTACIACRRRKSKVSRGLVARAVQYRAKMPTCDSATEILPVVLPVLRYMVPNVSTTPTRTIVVKAFTRRTSTVSKRATLHYRL